MYDIFLILRTQWLYLSYFTCLMLTITWLPIVNPFMVQLVVFCDGIVYNLIAFYFEFDFYLKYKL